VSGQRRGPSHGSRGRGRSRNGSRAGTRSGTPLAPNPPGAHFLTDQRIIAQLIAASGVCPGDLVLDLGAGYGALTLPLARTGARVIAVELDPGLARTLTRRCQPYPQVTVVTADLRTIPLPRRPFRVVASPPFSLTALLLRRLLDGDAQAQAPAQAASLLSADLILELGAARGLADAAAAGRHARYDVQLLRPVRAASFSPPPARDAAHVHIRPGRKRR